MSKHAHPFRIASLAGATAIALCSTTAQARGWSKSEAILGGQPSALQAILAQQQGIQAPARPALQPASYSSLPVVRAVVRDEVPASPAVLSGQPDVFGSVALRVGTTRLDARWQRVEHARIGGQAAHYAKALAGEDSVGKLEAVNRYVNRRVRFVDDSKQYGRVDVWAAAADTLSRGRGDCEDYAIAKFQMLRRAGFSDKDLYLVIVKDLITRGDHAVLVVRAAGRMYVLDNGTDRLLDSETIRDYRPVLTFAASGTWTHGYRIHSAPLQIASADGPETVASSAFAETSGQRSWSASLLALRTGFNK